ncbi:hypothetical protein ACEWY4_022114 [Coilia grayii]|uniref:Uncharacterized protein n=1 Tax=Coilia grayii TaxID=363190 RepID=A0ABD1J8D4_9TELE
MWFAFGLNNITLLQSLSVCPKIFPCHFMYLLFIPAALRALLLLTMSHSRIDEPLSSVASCSAEFVTSRQNIVQKNLKMAGVFGRWWGKVSPYYTKAYQEMWVGVGIMTYLYYKVSYGGKKAVDSSAHAVKSAPSHATKPAESAAPKAAAAAAAVAAASPVVVVGDVTMNDILQRQHKNLILEERKLNLEIEKLELEKAKLMK